MFKKYISLLLAFLIIAMPVLSYVRNERLDVIKKYKEDAVVYYQGNVLEDVSSRYDLKLTKINDRIRVKGSILVYGKGFRVELKKLNILSSKPNYFRKFWTRWGLNEIFKEELSDTTSYINTLSGNEADVNIMATLIEYPTKNSRVSKEQFNLVYKDGDLKIYTAKGDPFLSFFSENELKTGG